MLFTTIGEEAYKTLRDLCDPVLPKDKSYEQLCECLKRPFSPRISVFKERKNFYELKQYTNETVSQWYARIKKSAVNCKFGVSLEDRLKDKFVTGLEPGKILDRVCEESHRVNLKDVLEVALKKEATMETASAGESTSLNKISISRTSSRHQEPTSRTTVKCKHCGGVNHNFSKCKYRTYKCNNCKATGHLQTVCNKPRNENKTEKKSRTNYVAENKAESDDKLNLYSISQVNLNKNMQKIVEVKMAGVLIKMEIDSGAELSVIPETLHENYFSQIKLDKCSKILSNYDETPLKILG